MNFLEWLNYRATVPRRKRAAKKVAEKYQCTHAEWKSATASQRAGYSSAVRHAMERGKVYPFTFAQYLEGHRLQLGRPRMYEDNEP